MKVVDWFKGWELIDNVGKDYERRAITHAVHTWIQRLGANHIKDRSHLTSAFFSGAHAMTIWIETEEQKRRAKLFTDSVNAVWRRVLADSYTPALLCLKTCKPGRIERAEVVWSKESERLERKAEKEFLKLTEKDGVYNGESYCYGLWVGVEERELRQYHDDIMAASGLHYFELDKAVQLLQKSIGRVSETICPDFPPIAELYFDIAYFFYDHNRLDDHNEALEKGLAFYSQNLERRPRYFAPRVAKCLNKLAQVCLEKDDITGALSAYARLKALKGSLLKSEAEGLDEDWLSFARYYQRHGQIDEATASYLAVIRAIDWSEEPSDDEYDSVIESATALMKFGKLKEAEEVYEQLIEFCSGKAKLRTDKMCHHGSPCVHWFQPYFATLRKQNRLHHLSQICAQLNIDEAEHLNQRPPGDFFGYIDRDGKWQIPQRFEEAEAFNQGLAKVVLQESGARYQTRCLIDKSGNVVDTDTESFLVKPPDGYAQIHGIYDGMMAVRKLEPKPRAYRRSEPYKWGYADGDGNIVIEARFSEAKPFGQGLAIVGVGGREGASGGCVIKVDGARYGLIDRSGRYVIEPQFKRLEWYTGDLLNFERDNESGVMTTEGEIRSILPNCADTINCYDGMACVAWGEIDEGDPLARYGYGRKYGYLDANGRIAIEPRFEFAFSFEGDRALVKLNGKDGFINRKGEVVIDCAFDDALSFNRGLACVTTGELWGCIDEFGNWIVEQAYEKLEVMKSNHLRAQKDGMVGLLDLSGQMILEPQFDKIENFSNGFAIVTKDGLKGMIDASGSVVVEPHYRDVKEISDGMIPVAVLEEDGTLVWGYARQDGALLITPSFTDAKPFSNGLAAVRLRNSKQWGYIDRIGAFVVQPKFDEADTFCEERARVGIGAQPGEKLYGIIDTGGNYILAPEYHEVGKFAEGLCAVGRKKRR